MAIEVELPDGSVAEFPDGTPQATITAALQKQFGKPSPDAGPQQGAGRFAAPQMAGTKIPQGQPEPNAVVDVARSAASGLGKGLMGLVTLPGNIEQLGRMGINAAGRALGAGGNVVEPDTALTNYSDAKRRVEGAIGPLYEPQTTAGKFAGTVAEFAPAAMLGPGSAAARFMSNAVVPGIASEAAGQLTEGTSLEPWARAAGALAGPRVVTPFAQSGERAKRVADLASEGVTAVTAGQATGRMPLRWAEAAASDAPFVTKAGKINEKAAEQFTQAALRRIGETKATRATEDVIDAAYSRIGNEFNAMTIRSRIPVTPRLAQEAWDVANRYERRTEPSLTNRLPAAIADDIANAGGVIQGGQYLGWRSDIGKAARATEDTRTREALYSLQRILDDAAEATLKASGQTDMVDRFRKARRQYANLIVLSKAAGGAGENAALGFISPSALRNAVKTADVRAYVRGKGDFASLARAGEAILKPLPQSGTAPRAAATGLLGTFGGATGGFEGALGAVVGPAIAGNLLMSQPVQRYLKNQAVSPASVRSPSGAAPVLMQLVDGLKP